MLDFFSKLGEQTTLIVFLFIFLFVYFGGISVTWTCNICGKINETNVLKFMLCMCDHMGLR